jgi:hypothetical protein
MSVKRRIDGAERAMGMGVCAECGFDRNGLPVPLVFGKIDLDAPPMPDVEPAPCGACGVKPYKFSRITFEGDKEIRK